MPWFHQRPNLLTIYGASGGGTPPSALDYAISAARILNRNSPGARASVVDGTGLVTLNIYNTDSTINGARIASGGVVDESTVPYGLSCPVRELWILTEPQSPVDPSPTRTYSNGASNLFVFEGQVFEFKGGVLGAGSFALRWSTDGGTVWNEIYQATSDENNWYQFDFGSVATRVVEVIGCDQSLSINGYNFDTGTTPPLPHVDADLPLVTMFGDSYVFGQNADTLDNTTGGGTNANDQLAINGQSRKLAEYLGVLQVRNHGLRGNRFSPGVVNRSNYAERLSGGVYPDFAEALYDEDGGTSDRDLFIIPSTINDDAPGNDLVRRDACADAFRRIRELQPNCLVLFPVGARAPQFVERDVWLDDYKNGFNDAFGTTEAEWIQNGAYLHDGSRRDGADWTPAAAEGSLPTFGGVGFDVGHPTQVGHDLLAQKYSEGAIYLAKEVVKEAVTQGYGTELFNDNWTGIGANWVDNGDETYTASGTGNNSLSLNIAEITPGKAFVVRLAMDVTAGEFLVRLGGGANQSITVSDEYSYVLDDNTIGGLIIQKLTSAEGTVSLVSCVALS